MSRPAAQMSSTSGDSQARDERRGLRAKSDAAGSSRNWADMQEAEQANRVEEAGQGRSDSAGGAGWEDRSKNWGDWKPGGEWKGQSGGS